MTSYLDSERGLRSWLLTHDHKRIGVMFLIATAIALMVGGSFALLMRLELATPESTFVDPDAYDRLFTLHGVTMVWLFMIPAIPAGFGNFVLPILIGAEDVAFPRLNLLSFHIYVVGALVTLLGMLLGGADTGWTFYVPYAAGTPSAVIPILVGVFIVGWSSVITGLNFVVTVHTMRAEGMGWFDMPLFVWAVYATSIIQVIATPVLGMSLALVGLDAGFDLGIFDPARGGDPVLYQHLFWFYSHPAVYIMVLPAMGVVTEVVCTFSRKNPLSYSVIAYSTLGIAFVGFLAWGHHMFTAGLSTFDAAAFGILSMLVSIFSAIKVFTWVGTLYRGSIAVTTPLAYVFAFLFLFVFGGMTGVAVATTSLDVHWHDTYFVVAHFHFIMVGGTLTAYLAATHYWFPKITGRRYPERAGLLGAALVFVGFTATFVPQFLLGNAGMPRRYATYPSQFQGLNAMSTLGSWILALGLAWALGVLVVALRRGERAGPDPWGSACFEWRTSSPPPTANFEPKTPKLVGCYDYTRGAEGRGD
ncbi:MAG: cbb3-type cytochrome c oxidase subunit I [Sandaracinaceae bacterium]